MAWELILTPYDEREYLAIVSLARSPHAVRALRDRLHLRVRLRDRNPDVVALLNESHDLRPWIQVAFAETATRGPGVFLGRDATMEDYGKAAVRRYGERAEEIHERLAMLGETDSLLTRVPLDTVGQVSRISPEQLKALAGRLRALDPSLQPIEPEEADGRMAEGPGDVHLMHGEAFFDWALPTLFGLLLWAADQEDVGLALGFDAFPRLVAEEKFVGSKGELELISPEKLELLERRAVEVQARGAKVRGCMPLLLLVVVVLTLAYALGWFLAQRRLSGPPAPWE
jgi:hypothetical protein